MKKNNLKIAIRIETNEKEEILVKRINYHRFEFHGSGSFIWKIQPEEISISQKALDLLKKRIGDQYTSLGDLAGLDLSYNTTQVNPKHNGMTLNYAFLGPELNIPLEDVLIDYDFYEMLKQSNISETTLNKDPDDVKRWEEIEHLDKQDKSDEINKIIEKFYKS